MKILYVSPSYYPYIGGVEEHIKNIAERLAKEHEVTVFAGDPSGRLAKEEKIGGVLVRRFKIYSPSNAYHLSLEMANELRKAKFDIVHGHNYHAFPVYFSRFVKTNKFIVTPHYHGHGHTALSNFLLKPYKLVGKQIFQDADDIIAVSEYERELLIKDFKLDESRIEIIPNGINTNEFRNLIGVTKEAKTILYVGRLEEYKGIQYIIAAMPLLDKAFCLKIVGKGPYKSKLLLQINKLGLNARVTFFQDLTRQELLQMYAKASLFVLLSKLEAFSIVVAEALASKTPSIVANTSALTEWVDNESCYGIDYPMNIEKLAELITNTDGKPAGSLKIWDWDTVVNELLKIYSR